MRVAIIGIGQTKFGEHWNKSLRDLSLDCCKDALKNTGLDYNEIQALYLGNMSAGRFIGQEHLAALSVDHAALPSIPAIRCESACASGASAFRQGYLSIASGKHDRVMCLGIEKMTDLKTPDISTSLMSAGDQEWESSMGLTFPGLYALMARVHMHAFGTTQEQLAMVSVINHRNAMGNEYAQYQFEITIQDVLNSPMIADPLHLLDCSPITDGAACIILASEEIAKRFERPIWILATEQASDTIALHDRRSLVQMLATKHAARLAFEACDLNPNNMDLAEVHDCFSINEILSIENLGFCELGRGGEFVEEGKIEKNGEMPINTTGGLKAIGHPVGATGIRQLVDLTRQLRGESHNQVKDAKIGLALNVGGSGASAVVSILGSD